MSVKSKEITEMLEKMRTLDIPEYLWLGNMLSTIHTSVKNNKLTTGKQLGQGARVGSRGAEEQRGAEGAVRRGAQFIPVSRTIN